jgi:hypothetical protein
MADLVSLTAPNGSSVKVAKSRADALLAAGYTAPEKTTAKKASSSKSEK